MEDFIKLLFQAFDETPIEDLHPKKLIKEVDEWDSIVVLTIIDLADREYSKSINGEDIEQCSTIDDLFHLIVG